MLLSKLGCALLCALSLFATGCSSSVRSPAEDVHGLPDATTDAATTDAVADDLAGLDAGPASVLFHAAFAPFAEPPDEGPTVFLTTTKVSGPNLLTVLVRGRNLGSVAGLAFYVEYDPEFLTFDGAHNELDLGGGDTPFQTVDLFKELEPGRITVGVARFCKAKIPWGTVDQCGGVNVDEETTITVLSFTLKHPGTGALRFPAEHTVIRRPDRAIVDATWVGAAVQVADPGEVQP